MRKKKRIVGGRKNSMKINKFVRKKGVIKDSRQQKEKCENE